MRATPDQILPYMTIADPVLSRNTAARDPLGMLPVWSAYGREIVPFLATTVRQLDGVRAVLLIQWLLEHRAVVAMLEKSGQMRGFYRLMEGLVEWWLHENKGEVCFGGQSFGAPEAFEVHAAHTGMVANGLFQYYRGTCMRARFLEPGEASDAIHVALKAIWRGQTVASLVAALQDYLGKRVPKLSPQQLFASRPGLFRAFEATFAPDFLLTFLSDNLLGDATHIALAAQFGKQSKKDELGARILRLRSPRLQARLGDIARCEPFLLILQDVFDLLRASPGGNWRTLARQLCDLYPAMQPRARAFLLLGDETSWPRLERMQDLARELVRGGPTPEACLEAFVEALANYHHKSMGERRRDPMLVLEGDVVQVLSAHDRSVADARARLASGTPWMNDYYLGTAAIMHRQLFKDAA
ncbi:hypothetical protein [Duganella hordei]|uniref:hypothetical protein n=1 Tax=Duganella hordei TaxID=2865934 RepID=UPI0030E8C9DE